MKAEVPPAKKEMYSKNTTVIRFLPKRPLFVKYEVLLNTNTVKITGMIYNANINFEFIFLNILNIQ
ncbi:MAG: hypothetical protein ACTTHM_04780 [Peptoanaerobacter stomatis]|uniref:hypothetical protein n=1 Tax=Peptoanaerobacter stomatis TaxID=796937 RepID=UPI0002FD1CBB|nr:hypothetical protein [Peptoanaerobacter stomatis]